MRVAKTDGAYFFIADFGVQQANGALEDAGNNQLWYFEPVTGGYVIRNFETRQVLEVGADSTANGAAIDQWMALNQPNQAWTIQ